VISTGLGVLTLIYIHLFVESLCAVCYYDEAIKKHRRLAERHASRTPLTTCNQIFSNFRSTLENPKILNAFHIQHIRKQLTTHNPIFNFLLRKEIWIRTVLRTSTLGTVAIRTMCAGVCWFSFVDGREPTTYNTNTGRGPPGGFAFTYSGSTLSLSRWEYASDSENSIRVGAHALRRSSPQPVESFPTAM